MFQTATVLLHVIDHLDVPSLLNLRLVNKPINSLISCYESSIAKSLARNLCPDSEKPKLADYQPSSLRDLIFVVRLNLARKLATEAVSSQQVPRIGESTLEGVPADDDLGDEIRQKVQHGLMVISELSHIHKEVTRTLPKTNRWRVGISHFSGPTSVRRANERELLRRWQEYMNGLPTDDIVDFSVALWCVNGKLTFDNRATATSAALWNNVMADREIEAIQWTTYHLARKGLGFIENLWSQDQSIAQHAKAKIQTDIKQRSSKWFNLEYSTFRELLRSCRREHHQPPRSIYLNTINEADCYCESTFACRIGPHGRSPDELHRLRHDLALHSMMTVIRCFGTGPTAGGWKKEMT
ncbi:MAG: hypothetical protein L6R39_005282 [Caloplaca ligustica]|nr:MAG: hypothetical protein L6R39_005282 [Caloplaca ligustica]